MIFLTKGIRRLVWVTKDVNIGRTGLRNINFASVGTQVKFIITLKYFLPTFGTTC